jgi:putative transposase
LTFTETWEQRYPAIIKLWENAWPEFVPFLRFGACCTIVVDVDLVRVVGAARALAVSEGELSGCPVGLEEVEGDGGEVQFAVCAVQSAA